MNGRIERDPLAWVDLERDRLSADKGGGPSPLRPPARTVCLLLYKPRGLVTTAGDERGRSTVYDLLPPEARRWGLFPVGRLDKESEGLLLFTNDGPLGDALTDPSRHVAKAYLVTLDRPLSETGLRRWAKGVVIDGRPTMPAVIRPREGGVYEVRLIEGRNRQIRKAAALLGREVRRLQRLSIGPLRTEHLVPGGWRLLEGREIQALREACPVPGATYRRRRPAAVR